MNIFKRFVGIDWSGAKGATQSGIQLAEIEANALAPRLIRAPNGRKWSRSDVMEFIAQLRDTPTLVGIDFAFSVPWSTGGDLFGAHHVSDVRSLWALVESICDGTPHLYAGPVWTATNSPFRPYIFHHHTKHTGEHYDRRNRREVEKLEGNAISVYHMVGPQVGAGSFSGMRMLHHVAKSREKAIAIWPFDVVDGTKTAVVEIYPSFFYRKAGARRPNNNDLKGSNYAEIDKVLSYYGAARAADFDVCRSVDQADALISAAALRKLADNAAFESPESRNFDLREGWIFGFPLDGSLLPAA
jgi:hypothetical protein